MKNVIITLFCLTLLTSITFAEFSVPKETIQQITLDSFFDETRTINDNEYLVYSFSGNSGNVINVSIDVVNGNAIDIFLLNSEQFINYQSILLGSSSKDFYFFSIGHGNKIKSKSYSFEFPETDKYYIMIDNTFRPENGAIPSGNVDVKLTITNEGCPSCIKAIEALEEDLRITQKSIESTNEIAKEYETKENNKIPGFNVIYPILIILILFHLFKRE